jgi:hypothetical protein
MILTIRDTIVDWTSSTLTNLTSLIQAYNECLAYSANCALITSGFDSGTNLSKNRTKGLVFYGVKSFWDRHSANLEKYASTNSCDKSEPIGSLKESTTVFIYE